MVVLGDGMAVGGLGVLPRLKVAAMVFLASASALSLRRIALALVPSELGVASCGLC